jgi:transcriptional regulator with XRE-family HTH domain
VNQTQKSNLNQLSVKLGKAIIRHASVNNLDVRDLAKTLGRSVRALKRSLSGSSPLTIDELAVIAKWLDLPLAALLAMALAHTNKED